MKNKMTKKQIYICLTLSFISLSFIAAHYESIWALMGAIILLSGLIEDKEWYLGKKKNKDDVLDASRYTIGVDMGGPGSEKKVNIDKTIKKNKTFPMQKKEVEVLKKTEINITKHAKERLVQRFKCKEGKIRKVVKKAWNSNDKISIFMINKLHSKPSANRKDTYKYYQGIIFIFRDDKYRGRIRKNLITVFNPKKSDQFSDYLKK